MRDAALLAAEIAHRRIDIDRTHALPGQTGSPPRSRNQSAACRSCRQRPRATGRSDRPGTRTANRRSRRAASPNRCRNWRSCDRRSGSAVRWRRTKDSPISCNPDGRSDRASSVPICAAECWPSASIVTACVKAFEGGQTAIHAGSRRLYPGCAAGTQANRAGSSAARRTRFSPRAIRAAVDDHDHRQPTSGGPHRSYRTTGRRCCSLGSGRRGLGLFRCSCRPVTSLPAFGARFGGAGRSSR